MAETAVHCAQCGAVIQQVTATRTGGLCMPCKTGRPRPPDPNEPLEVSCSASSEVAPEPVFFVSAQDLLHELEQRRHIGDSGHANRFELEAQKALLRHAIRYRVQFRLHDDHWGATGWALLNLFEEGKATMHLDDRTFQFADVCKEEWRVGTNPLGSRGGFCYRDRTGTIVFKRWTWIS